MARHAEADGAPGDTIYQDDWIRYLVNRFGSAATGGVAWYAIDNEPDLWATTHTDVHPVEPDYDEMLSAFVAYASAIKDVDPSALVSGPSLSGWLSMFYSARDRGTDNFRTHADRKAHGDMPFLAWWLDSMRQYDADNGRRLLDAVDVHFYPQAAGIFGPVGDEATQRLRVRSTRALWDPTYRDESWINDTVQLIPRLRALCDQYYPGTRIAVGEWNWGAEQTMNGALAVANVLGIFGREGVDLAAYWTSPEAGTPAAQAFALYTNYDGQGGRFGDQALGATSSAPDEVVAYASRDSATGHVIVAALNHRPDAAVPAALRLPRPIASIKWWMLDRTQPGRIRNVEGSPADDVVVRAILPPESLSVFHIALIP
jgi:hypothetical protein